MGPASAFLGFGCSTDSHRWDNYPPSGSIFHSERGRRPCYPLYPSLLLFPVSLTAISSALPLYHLYASNCRHVAYVQPSPQWKQAVRYSPFILIRAIHTLRFWHQLKTSMPLSLRQFFPLSFRNVTVPYDRFVRVFFHREIGPH